MLWETNYHCEVLTCVCDADLKRWWNSYKDKYHHVLFQIPGDLGQTVSVSRSSCETDSKAVIQSRSPNAHRHMFSDPVLWPSRSNDINPTENHCNDNLNTKGTAEIYSEKYFEWLYMNIERVH